MATAKRRMNRWHYSATWSALFRRVPGPVALVWGLCAVAQFAIIVYLLREPIQTFGAFVAIFAGMWFFQAIQKGLYAPLREIADRPDAEPTLGNVLGTSLRRLGAVFVIQFLIGLIFALISVVFITLGAPLFAVFVVLQMFWFLLAPAVYFVVVRRDSSFEALHRTLGVARRYLLWIVGVPTVFWCLGSVLDEYIWSLAEAAIALFASDTLTLMRGLFLYVLFRYLRWLSVAAVYIAVDLQLPRESDGDGALILRR